MKNCLWEAINDFRSLNEFERFEKWMNEQVTANEAVEVTVIKPYINSNVLREKWFLHLSSGEIWRLVWPDIPFTGIFEQVSGRRFFIFLIQCRFSYIRVFHRVMRFWERISNKHANIVLVSGKSYRLLNDMKIGDCIFKKGEIVTYVRGSDILYVDCYVYQFINAAGKSIVCKSYAKLKKIKNFEEISQQTPYLIPGISYRLLNDTKIGNRILKKGEVVTYDSGGFSRYDDCYIYHFINAVAEEYMCMSQTELTVVEMKNFERISMETRYLISGFSYRLINKIKIGDYMFKKGDIVTYVNGGYLQDFDGSYPCDFINATTDEYFTCTSKTKLTAVEMENFERILG